MRNIRYIFMITIAFYIIFGISIAAIDYGEDGYSGTHTCEYTKNCGVVHCTGKVCPVAGCGAHQGTCTGGHSMTGSCPNTWNHCSGGGTCTKKNCSVSGCSATTGSCYRQHSYSTPCGKAHCSQFVCSGCGIHQNSCGGDHIYSDPLCVQPKICIICGDTIPGSELNHDPQNGCGAIHCTSTMCRRCGLHNCNGGHKLNDICSATHCTEKVCSVEGCSYHEGDCGGICRIIKCVHCEIVGYCKICKTHTPYVDCPCGTAAPCSNSHCIAAGIDLRRCDWCDLHTCVGCNESATCNLPHCGKKMCSVCKKHECIGGHQYTKWITNSTAETQTHSKICEINNCGVVGETHTSKWGVADTNHTSICTLGCGLTYTHDPIWVSNSEDSTDSLHADICAKIIGGTRCTATRTHTPTWGQYYKVGYESTSSRGDDNSSVNNHTRRCTTCSLQETEHNYTDEAWTWIDNSEHRRTCRCGLRQKENHTFSAFDTKNESSDYSHIVKHWSICEKCDKNHQHKSKDDIHVDNNKDGVCDLCKQVIWAIIKDEVDITEKVIDEDRRRATNSEKIKIIEGSYDGTTAVVRNVNSVKDKNGNTIVSDSNGIVTITENGEYKFSLASGATVTIVIDNISKEILVDIFKTPETATTGQVKILVRTSNSEQEFDKKIFIKEGQGRVTDAELAGVTTQPFEATKTVSSNGTYYFSARDTAGNEKIIKVIVNNIVNGQATVAISNDVFVGGYVFTEILVNPSKNWNLYDNISSSIQTSVTRVGDSNEDGIDIGESGIKKISVMDLRRKPVTIGNGQNYAPGVYYIKLAIGGSDVFKEKGTHVVDLKSVTFKDGTTVNGINRIIVEVQELNDLT